MGVASMTTLLLTNPNEFKTLVQFWLWHEPRRDITSTREHETSGWDRASMRKCWEFLDMTSRSFAAVIKELDGDLARVICLFYLVLRGLDTIEDDMTIPDEVKQPILRSFHDKILTPGWCFDGCASREKDRELLVKFSVVVEELRALPLPFRDVIVDICHKMETGMADYAHKAAVAGKLGLDTIQDFDLYCHYVAGLVGEGLSRLFSASGKEADWLGEQLTLSNSMGLMLQKTNILRDFREDVNDGRLFWPREIWGAYGFEDPKEMYRPEREQQALWALSEMTLDTLRHAIDALDYLTLLRNQTVFNFCAIPQTMAMATLAVCFMNPQVFHRNVKIRKAEAARLIMNSTNPRDVAYLFRDYARQIHKKSIPADPNFLRISVACGKIEQWCELHYPSFVKLVTLGNGKHSQSYDPSDPRTRIAEASEKRAAERAHALTNGNGATNGAVRPADDDFSTTQLMLYVGGILLLIVILSLGIVGLMLRIWG